MVRYCSNQVSLITAERVQKSPPKKEGLRSDLEPEDYFQPLATTSAKSTTRWL